MKSEEGWRPQPPSGKRWEGSYIRSGIRCACSSRSDEMGRRCEERSAILFKGEIEVDGGGEGEVEDEKEAEAVRKK